MAGALVCSGMLGLSGTNGLGSPPGWSTFAPNLSNRRSIAFEAGFPASASASLNDQAIRNLAGGAYVPSSSAINMGAFYNGPPTYAWASLPNPIGEGQAYTYTVTTTKIANGAVLNWSLGNTGGAAGQVSPTSGSMTVFNNSASFSFSTVADQFTDGAKTLSITVSRSTDGVAVLLGTVTVNDTSVSKSAFIANPISGQSINEGTIYTVTVNNAGFNNGDTLFWTATGAATAFSGSFTTNGANGYFNITTTGGAYPNVLVGTYCGVEARQAGNQSLALQIRRDGTAGTILASATFIVTDSNLGGVNTITWTQNSTPLIGTTINTAYSSGATAGFTRSGGPYRIGLANNIQITIPGGQYVLNGLTINGTGNTQDRYFITVNGGLIGRGGSAAAQAGSPGLTLQSLGASTVTLNGSGVIAGGGGAGGGYGRCSQPLGGYGAGTVLSQPQAVGATGTSICRGARQGGGGGNYWSGGPVGLGAWQPGGSTIGQGGGGGGGGGGAIWYDPAFTGTGAGNWKGGNGGTIGMGTNASFSNTVALGAGAAGGGGGGLGYAGTSGVLRNSTFANHAGGSAGSAIAGGGSPISGSVAVERGNRT